MIKSNLATRNNPSQIDGYDPCKVSILQNYLESLEKSNCKTLKDAKCLKNHPPTRTGMVCGQ